MYAEYGSLKNENFEGAKDMREELFLASKKRDDVIEDDKHRPSEDDHMEVLEVTAPSFSPLQNNADKA